MSNGEAGQSPQPPVPLAPPQDSCHSEFARHVHSYLQHFIRSADQKASFLLVAGTALFGLIYKENLNVAYLVWVRLAALIILGSSVFLSVLAVMPRQQNEKFGLIAWEGIRQERQPYGERVKSQTPTQLLDELLSHCQRLAEILHSKYHLLYAAVWFFLVGGVCAAAFLTAGYAK